MPDCICYESGTGLKEIRLNAKTFVGSPNDLHSRSWSYSLSGNNAASVQRAASKAKVAAFFSDLAEADAFRRVSDRDVKSATPGLLHVGEWSQRCYVMESEVKRISTSCFLANLTLAMLDGVWRRAHKVDYIVNPKYAHGGLDFPFDLPSDVGAPKPSKYLEAWEWGESPLRIVFYGPCENPSVSIGGNVYAVDVTVPEGGRVEIDPLARPRTVEMVLPGGTRVDAFGKARRGDGPGRGEYVFEPVPAGVSSVESNGAFGFELTWYEEEGEPSWC